MIIGYYMAGKIIISINDILLGFIAGFFQLGFGFIFYTSWCKNNTICSCWNYYDVRSNFWTSWAWLFINEQPPYIVFIGGINSFVCCFVTIYEQIFCKKRGKLKNLCYIKDAEETTLM